MCPMLGDDVLGIYLLLFQVLFIIGLMLWLHQRKEDEQKVSPSQWLVKFSQNWLWSLGLVLRINLPRL